MTRLEVLCAIHGKQGGIIHDYNRLYGVDILSLNETQWESLKKAIESMYFETVKERN